MRYVGNKGKIAHHLLPILLESRGNRPWVEPFVGGANMITRIRGGRRIGNDIHPALIALHKAVQQGWQPPTHVTPAFYDEVKANQAEYPPHLVAFIGFGCSWGGLWFHRFATDADDTDYSGQSSRSLLRAAPYYQGIEFTNLDYRDLPIPPNSLIYCDPPYAGTVEYNDEINHTEFWQWCRERANDGHLVFVSEYTAPEDFTCVKSIHHRTQLQSNQNPAVRSERLFTPTPQLVFGKQCDLAGG